MTSRIARTPRRERDARRPASAARLRARRGPGLALLAFAVAAPALGGCAYFSGRDECEAPSAPSRTPPAPQRDSEIYRRAQSDRADYLAREVERLRVDLDQAEEALVAVESGLRGEHTRAGAVSSLADARIQVERAARGAPWRENEIAEARRKLEDADRQMQAGHFGSAIFFTYRAQSIAETLLQEARAVEQTANPRFVRGERVNLRVGPSERDAVLGVLTRGTPIFPERSRGRWVLVRTVSGSVGWVHGSLISGARGSGRSVPPRPL